MFKKAWFWFVLAALAFLLVIFIHNWGMFVLCVLTYVFFIKGVFILIENRSEDKDVNP